MYILSHRGTMRRIWAICRNTIGTWLRNGGFIAAAFAPGALYYLIEILMAAAVAHSRVALVNLDNGQQGRQMQQIFHQADVFRISDATPAEAQDMLQNIQVAAIITIPADFSQRVATHQRDPIDVTINNLNLDFTNDIRRSVPDAITQFYAAQGRGNPIVVTMHERDMRQQDIQLFEYELLPTLLLLILIAGLVNATVSTAREYQLKTIKGLLLSPASNAEIVAGKLLAFFLIAFGAGVLGLGIGAVFGWACPATWEYWLNDLLIIAMTSLFASSVGLALGAALQRIQPGHATATIFSLYYFLLAGGVGVEAFNPQWLQNIGRFIPLTYARHALELSTFYSSSDQFGSDLAVLVLCVLVTVGLDVLVVRRKLRT